MFDWKVLAWSLLVMIRIEYEFGAAFAIMHQPQHLNMKIPWSKIGIGGTGCNILWQPANITPAKTSMGYRPRRDHNEIFEC